MFNSHKTPQTRALNMQMSDHEICAAASLTMLTITTVTHEICTRSNSLDYDMGAIHLAAALCFPDTYRTDPHKAVTYVTEIIDVLRANQEHP